MNFHLQFPVHPFKEKLKYPDKILFIGSCFAENIGDIFQQYKFKTLINPHGILYNPLSIAVAIQRYIKNKPVAEEELFLSNECWSSWEHHSCFSGPDKKQLLSDINKNISLAHEQIKSSEWLFITFGSAFIYTLKESNQLVGNCHKLPQAKFTKHLLVIDKIVEEYNLLINQLKEINPRLKIVFTISPVRYTRDGVVENNRSKARLTEAAHRLVEENVNAFYFPAYELVIDDLRDYRFYKEDLVHPNQLAITYVFEKLADALFNEETKQIFGKIKDIITAQQHKPFNQDTIAHRKFKTVYFERCQLLQNEYSFLDFTNEISFFNN